MSSQFTILQSFQQLLTPYLSWAPLPKHLKSEAWRARRSVPAGLQLDPRTRALVLNARPGQLQFYSLTQDRCTFSLPVVQENYVSPASLDNPSSWMADVRCVAFTPEGSWMATCEARDPPSEGIASTLHKSAYLEVKLKFWRVDSTSNNFSLNTSVELAHYCGVRAIGFVAPTSEASASDDSHVLISCGESDGLAKVWALQRVLAGDEPGRPLVRVYWACVSSVRWRACAGVGPLATGPVGLVAIAFTDDTHTCYVTTWDLSRVLDGEPTQRSFFAVSSINAAAPPPSITDQQQTKKKHKKTAQGPGTIVNMAFGRREDINYLIVCCQRELLVFDHRSSNLFVFRAGSCNPLAGERLQVKCAHAMFAPGSRLYLLTQKHELYSVDVEALCSGDIPRTRGEPTSGETRAPFAAAAAQKLVRRLPQTPLARLLTAQRTSLSTSENEQKRPRLVVPPKKLAKLIEQVMGSANEASHTLPPIALLCGSYFSCATILLDECFCSA